MNTSNYPLSTIRYSLKKGQVVMEFIFSMVIVFLLVYALIRAFRWAGIDLAERREAYDNSLLLEVNEKWTSAQKQQQSPLRQLDLDFYETKKINMIIPQW